MKKLKLALMGVCLAWTAQAAYADDCYSDSLMAYVDSRIPSGNQVERRWEKIKAALLEQDGGITLERAEEILANRKARGFGLERMDEVVAALKCLAAQPEPEPEPEVVIVPPEPEPEDPPQPLNSDTPKPQQAGYTNFRAYFHDEGPMHALTAGEYRINEDDRWESELIIHVESNEITNLNAVNSVLCINHDIWSGNDYWNNGPISLPGFNNYLDRKSSPTWDSLKGTSKQYGYWQCTDNIGADPTPPNITILNPEDDGDDGNTANDDGIVEFIYRAKIRTRDNNVVEDDFRVSDLEFRYALALTGKTKWRAETETLVDRDSWWRMDRDAEAFPGTHGTYCLGTGSAWERFTPLRCGDQVASKYLDRAPLVGGNCDKSHSDYTVRADVSEAEWMPDRCFPTKQVPKIPPTPPNTQPTTHDDTSLPIIEEDDVSYIKLHKVNGKWTVSLSKPVMVTDGTGWENTSHGLAMNLGSVILTARNILIPAENGIVKDKDYTLNDLVVVDSSNPPPTGIETFAEQCGKSKIHGGLGGAFHLNTSATNYVVNEPLVSLPISELPSSLRHYKRSLRLELPSHGADLCN